MTAPDEPKVCIIGAGSLSSKRIYPYLATAGGKLVGVCDLDEAKARKNARLYGGTAYSDLKVMLDQEKPDGVIICTGPDGHAHLAQQVLRLGYPVYTEKPPAPTARDALAVAQTARETGLLCTTAYKKRYTRAADRAREWISQFAPEDLYSISVDYCSAQYPNDPANPNRTFLLDFTVHILDLVPYLFGDVTEVFAFSKGLDAYAVSLKFTHGGVGTLNLNCGRSFQVPTEEIEITARGGNFMTIHNSSCWKITENGKPSEWREPPTFTSSGDSGYDTGHLRELEDFIQALQEGRTTTRSHIFESYKSLALYEAIGKSAETGQVVPLKYATF